jgi:hypothetical protein
MLRRCTSQVWAGAATLLTYGVLLCPSAAVAGTLQVCRTFDIASPNRAALVVPAQTLFRDNGRADDPLAAFDGDRWQLRLETIADAVIPPLQRCIRVLVRVYSDSSVKSVSIADNRTFVYAGSSSLLDRPLESEEIMTLTGKVLDQVP